MTETTFSVAQAQIIQAAAGKTWDRLHTALAELGAVLAQADSPNGSGFGVRIGTSYDSLGRQSSVVHQQDYDGDGTFEIHRASAYGYDPITGGVRSVDSPEGRIEHQYDPATGRLERTWTGDNDTGYEYDAMGRLWKVTVTKLNGQALSLVTEYVYDAVGNLDLVRQPNGVVEDYGYDGLNRLTSLVVTDGEGDTLFEQAYALLPDGQRDYVIEKRYDGQSVDPFSKVKIDWTYDALNRLVAETRDADPTPGTDTSEDFGTPDATFGDCTDFFGFDLAGNRLLKLRGWDANGNGRWDAGEPVSERIAYRYNDRDQLLSEGPDANADGLPDPATELSYAYDDNGNTTAKGTDAYAWDLRGRLAAVDTNGDGILDDAGDAVYAYDHNGTRIARTIFALAGDGLSFTANAGTNSLTLTSGQLSGGMRITLSIEGGELPAELEAGQSYYVIDNGDGTYRLAQEPGGAAIDLTSNGSGTLTLHAVVADETQYLYDKQNPTGYAKALQESVNGTLERSYILGLRVEGQGDADGPAWFIRDGHGSNRLLTNEDGVAVEWYDYAAYGEPVYMVRLDPQTQAATAITANEARTTEQFGGDGVYDRATGWTYHLARWRDGHRFVSYDSFEADPTSPAYLHKYLYANANPVYYADPSGYESLISQLGQMGIKDVLYGMVTGAAIGAGLGGVIGGATGAYLHIVTHESFDGIGTAIWDGAKWGAIWGAVIGASSVNPQLLAITLAGSLGYSAGQAALVVADSGLPVRTKVAVCALLLLQGTLARASLQRGVTAATDPNYTQNCAARAAYLNERAALQKLITELQRGNANTEGIARAVVEYRNNMKVQARGLMMPEGVAQLEARNQQLYGNKIGPTPEQMLQKYGSWDEVIRASVRTNAGVDANYGPNRFNVPFPPLEDVDQ